VKAGRDYTSRSWAITWLPDMVAGAKLLEDLAAICGSSHRFDERRGSQPGKRHAQPSRSAPRSGGAVNVPVQAVGGLTLEQAIRTPEYGAPLWCWARR